MSPNPTSRSSAREIACEFLRAAGKQLQADNLDEVGFVSSVDELVSGAGPIPAPVHDVLLESLGLYMLLGGMPAMMNVFFTNPAHPSNSFRVQDERLQTLSGCLTSVLRSVKSPALQQSLGSPVPCRRASLSCLASNGGDEVEPAHPRPHL